MVSSIKRIKLAQKISLLLSFVISSIIIVVLYAIFQQNHAKYVILILSGVFSPLVIYLFLMRKYRRRRKILAQTFPKKWEAILNKEVAYFSFIKPEQKERFKQEVQIFLYEKMITGIETEVDDRIKLLIAASAVIPIMKFPDWEYDNLQEILVYPRSFNDNFQFDEPGGNIIGMVGIGSTMVLSKDSLIAGFKNNKDKKNVGIHEFIHKVDEKDGIIDGIPALLINRNIQKKWRNIMLDEMQKMEQGKSDINLYALTNEAEFFAVVGEYFFENPEVMSRKHPVLYQVLTEIFRQDTKTMFRRVVKSLFRPYGKKIGRNSPCPCGSGKKYKFCCLKKKQ